MHGVLGVVAERLDQLRALPTATAAVTTAADAEQPLGLGLHVAAVARDHMPSGERLAKFPQREPVGGGEQHRCPQRHQDRRVARYRQPQEPAQRVHRAIGVPRTRADAFRLRPVHPAARPRLGQAKNLGGSFHHHGELVVVLPARKPGAVRSRTHLDQQDRGRRQRRDDGHRATVPGQPACIPPNFISSEAWSPRPVTSASGWTPSRPGSRAASDGVRGDNVKERAKGWLYAIAG